MPFITEKLWSSLFNQDSLLMNEIDKKIYIQDNFVKSQNNFKALIKIITSVRNLRSELNISYRNKIKLNINFSYNILVLYYRLQIQEHNHNYYYI